jgi:hypothetical protein
MLEIDKHIDMRNYANMYLRKLLMLEKRELLVCLKSKIFLKNKSIFLENQAISVD